MCLYVAYMEESESTETLHAVFRQQQCQRMCCLSIVDGQCCLTKTKYTDISVGEATTELYWVS